MTPVIVATEACRRGGLEGIAFDRIDLVMAFIQALSDGGPLIFLEAIQAVYGIVPPDVVRMTADVIQACFGGRGA